MTIVQNPVATPALTNSVSSEAPMTTSGVAIGRNTSRLVEARPRNECRTRAKASSVPSTVATAVAITPTCRLRTTASHMPGTRHGVRQASSVKPCQVKLYRPVGSLKLEHDDDGHRQEQVEQHQDREAEHGVPAPHGVRSRAGHRSSLAPTRRT